MCQVVIEALVERVLSNTTAKNKEGAVGPGVVPPHSDFNNFDC